MKTIILSLIILLFGCSTKSSEEIRVEVYKLYQEARAIPASNYCGNFNSYVNLRSLEKEYRTNFYSEITEEKIRFYDVKCREKKQEKQARKEFAKEASDSIVLKCIPRERVRCSPLSSNYNGENYLFKLNIKKEEVTSLYDIPYKSKWKSLTHKVEGNPNFRDVIKGLWRPIEPSTEKLYTYNDKYSWWLYEVNRRTLILDLGNCPDMTPMLGYTRKYNGSISRGKADCEIVDYQVFDDELKAKEKDIIEHDEWVYKNKHRLTDGNKI